MTDRVARISLLLLLFVINPLYAQFWNTNLVVNGDAESGPAANNRTTAPITNIPGWTREGSFTVLQYGGPMLLQLNTTGPETRGKNYFNAGPGGGKSIATQTIDLSAGAVEIDAGRARFYLSGYLYNGGTGSFTEVKLTATFLDKAGATLIEQQLQASIDVHNDSLSCRAGSGFLVPNTRSVRLTLDLTRAAIGFSAAGADNISLLLALEPIMGSNLAVNGDAEATKGERSHNTAKPVPGWNAPESFGVGAYGGVIDLKDPGPTDRGLNYFFARTYGATADVNQFIDVTLAKDRIDANGVTFKLSAWVGGEDKSDDASIVKVLFYGATGTTPLGSTTQVGPVKAADRGSKSALLLREAEGAIPPGTRRIEIRMTFSSVSGKAHPAAEIDNIVLTLRAGGSIAIKENGILHGATLEPGPVAPGEILAINVAGVDLSTTTRLHLNSDGMMATTLGDVRVFFDGTQAPLLYVNSSQIGAIVPFDVDAKKNVVVRVEYKGAASPEVSVPVVPTRPGVFVQDGSAKGVGLICNENYSPNGQDAPAASGSTITIYWTGGGQLDPAGRDGRIESMPLSRVKAPLSVTIGGVAADVVFAGGVPYGWAGLLMAVVTVPALPAGDPSAMPVVLTSAGVSSPDKAVTVWVKP